MQLAVSEEDEVLRHPSLTDLGEGWTAITPTTVRSPGARDEIRQAGSLKLADPSGKVVDIAGVRPDPGGSVQVVAGAVSGSEILLHVNSCRSVAETGYCSDDLEPELILVDEDGTIADRYASNALPTSARMHSLGGQRYVIASQEGVSSYYATSPIAVSAVSGETGALAVDSLESPGSSAPGFPGSSTCTDDSGALYALKVSTSAEPGKAYSDPTDLVTMAAVVVDMGGGRWQPVEGMVRGESYWGASLMCAGNYVVMFSGGRNPAAPNKSAESFEALVFDSASPGTPPRRLVLPPELSVPLRQAVAVPTGSGDLVLCPSGFLNSESDPAVLRLDGAQLEPAAAKKDDCGPTGSSGGSESVTASKGIVRWIDPASSADEVIVKESRA